MATTQEMPADVGKRWIEEACRRLAGEHNVPVTNLRWKDDYPGAFLYTLYFDVQDAGHTGSVELTLRQVEDCRNPAKQAARTGVEDNIRSSLRNMLAHRG